MNKVIVVLKNISNINRLVWAKGQNITVKPGDTFECYEREANGLVKLYKSAYEFVTTGEYNIKTGEVKLKDTKIEGEDVVEDEKEDSESIVDEELEFLRNEYNTKNPEGKQVSPRYANNKERLKEKIESWKK